MCWYRIPDIYARFRQSVDKSDAGVDVKLWSDNYGANMVMAWPQFEVKHLIAVHTMGLDMALWHAVSQRSWHVVGFSVITFKFLDFLLSLTPRCHGTEKAGQSLTGEDACAIISLFGYFLQTRLTLNHPAGQMHLFHSCRGVQWMHHMCIFNVGFLCSLKVLP